MGRFLTDEVVNQKSRVGESQRGYGVAVSHSELRSVLILFRITIDKDQIVVQILNPNLWNSIRGKPRQLDASIAADCGIRNFDKEQNVSGSWCSGSIKIGSWLENNYVRLWHVVNIQPQRILNADHGSSPKSFRKKGSGPIHAHNVAIADGSHLDDFSVDKFDTFFRP